MKLLLRLLWAAPILLAPAWSRCQVNAPAAAPASQAACPELDTTKLENNQAILDKATGLANSIIGLFNSSQPDIPPKMFSRWGMLNAEILEQLPIVCQIKAATPQANAAAQNQIHAQANTSQTNKQTGAPSTQDGATSPVQKVGVPELLGIAVENGAITNNVSGTTMTLSTTPYGFFMAFGKQLDAQDTPQNYRRFHWATQTAVSATFNVANSSDPLASATRKQVTQWQTKFTFRDTSVRSRAVEMMYDQDTDLGNALDAFLSGLSNSEFFSRVRTNLNLPLDHAYQSNWSALKTIATTGPDASTETQIATALLKALDTDAGYQAALKNMEALIETQARGQFKNGSYVALLRKLRSDDLEVQQEEAKLEKKVEDLPKGWNGDFLISEKFPAQVTSTTSTASTTAFRMPGRFAASSSSSGPGTPAYFVSELDITCQPKDDPKDPAAPCPLRSSGTFTANFSASFYPNPVASLNEKTFRGAQAALQGEWDLGPGFVRIKQPNDKSKMTLALSANYERLQENKDQKGKRPDLAIGNIKLSIPIFAGVALPVSITVASAGEQNKEKYVRGNFGITFDLDKLSALLKANQ